MAIFGGKIGSFFGLDLSSASVKVTQLRFGVGKPALVTYGGIGISESALKSDSKIDRENLASNIKQLLDKANISTHHCVTSLPTSSVFTTIIQVPKMTKKELSEAIYWEAKKYVPTPINEVELDWQILKVPNLPVITPKTQGKSARSDVTPPGKGVPQRESGSDMMDVFLVAAPKYIVEKYLDIIRTCGLEPLAIEIDSMSLLRSLAQNEVNNVMIVDIGATSTGITVAGDQVIKLTRGINIGGSAITRSVAQVLGVDAARAEQFKHDFGINETKLEGQMFKATKPVIDNITSEMMQAINLFKDHKAGEIKKIILSGGTANMPELTQHVSRTFNLEVAIGNPWANINYPFKLSTKLSEIGPSFAVSVGLALRQV